jgi:hypothetical protein
LDCVHCLIKINEKINGINEHTMFQELALFLSSSNKTELKLKQKVGGATQLDPLHRANLNPWIVQSLHSRAIAIYQERQDLSHEIYTMKKDLLLSAYPDRN